MTEKIPELIDTYKNFQVPDENVLSLNSVRVKLHTKDKEKIFKFRDFLKMAITWDIRLTFNGMTSQQQ